MGRQNLPAHSPFVGLKAGRVLLRALANGLKGRDSALPLSPSLDYRDAAMNVRYNSSGSTRLTRLRGSTMLVAAGLALLPSTADAAHVKGQFQGFRSLQNPVWAEAKDPKNHGYSFREPVPTVRAEFRRPFPHIPKELCVAAIAAGPQKAQPPVLIRVGGGRTTPVTIVVTPGTRLTFQNTDPFKHKIYGVGIKTFASSETGPGATRDWSVPEAGVFEIRDDAAPSLRMWIVAEPNVASVAYPSLKGEFSINVQEPGDYTLQAYFSGKKVGAPMPVTVTEKDLELKAPIKVDSGGPPAADDKPTDDKPKEGAK
jgi:plastocyanin